MHNSDREKQQSTGYSCYEANLSSGTREESPLSRMNFFQVRSIVEFSRKSQKVERSAYETTNSEGHLLGFIVLSQLLKYRHTTFFKETER